MSFFLLKKQDVPILHLQLGPLKQNDELKHHINANISQMYLEVRFEEQNKVQIAQFKGVKWVKALLVSWEEK